MSNETFKKRQKERARREKREKKAARLMERRNERAKTASDPQQETAKTADSVSRIESKGTQYFTSAARPRDPNKKSEITLHNVKSS
jgi:predicted AAA+ superfamily ATPase